MNAAGWRWFVELFLDPLLTLLTAVGYRFRLSSLL